MQCLEVPPLINDNKSKLSTELHIKIRNFWTTLTKFLMNVEGSLLLLMHPSCCNISIHFGRQVRQMKVVYANFSNLAPKFVSIAFEFRKTKISLMICIHIPTKSENFVKIGLIHSKQEPLEIKKITYLRYTSINGLASGMYPIS